MASCARTLALSLLLLAVSAMPISAAERPFIADTFFYWYTWDYDREFGGWVGGVYNTPLEGYYDSRTFRDNYRSLRTASEWGMTHHYMDYWSPDWKADTGEMREAVVMRAAEQLRREGYNIWMSYYQDGENFAMRDFARNVTEKRDVYQWLRDFARSPVWPRIGGRPMQLVYSRNGAPLLTQDDAGFRGFLAHRYGSIARLNREWGTRFSSFDQITHDLGATGWHRAMAVRYQYLLWQRDWSRLQEAVRKEFGLPGMAASFDVGYPPYQALSYVRFARLFGGPHSYAGIFDVPHAQDAERFIQAIVAKRYGTVFFDHLKNFYHDWEIRIPGTGYLPDPFHFDRFWVGNLMRYVEGVLHLSWNEWWEGSNLEPCFEYGKTYPEKNLFYSTLMQECFADIRAFGKGARTAVVLNDWLVEAGADNASEPLAAIQAVRRSMIPFDLLPDEFVTDRELSRFSLVVAPAGALGFGRNGRDEPIADVLLRWVRGRPGRKLIVSGSPELARTLGLAPPRPSAARRPAPGADLNVFVDVGASGDDRFVSGGSLREDWGRLAPASFGAARQPLTVRWTPGSGRRVLFTFPSSPGRDHVLRFRGRPFRDNPIEVLVEDQPVGRLSLSGDFRVYEVRVPERLTRGVRRARVVLLFPQPVVPAKVDPEHFPGEMRSCNLALDWVQWCTSNLPFSRAQRYRIPQERLRLTGWARELPLRGPGLRPIALPQGARVLSRLGDGSPRDVVLRAGRGQVLYVNGLLSDVDAPEYWEQLLTRWGGLRADTALWGPGVMGSRLRAGDTEVLFAYNMDGTRAAPVQMRAPARQPVASVRALARDGVQWRAVPFAVEAGQVRVHDRVRYYGVYEIARGPVRVTWPNPVLQPGEARQVMVRLENLTSGSVRGRLSLATYVPTVRATPAAFSLPPRATAVVAVRVRVDPRAEWGRRTVVLRVEAGGRRSSLWQPLVIERNPDVVLEWRFPAPGRATCTLRNRSSPYIGTAPVSEGELSIRDVALPFGRVAAGRAKTIEVPAASLSGGTGSGGFRSVPVTLSYASRGLKFRREETVSVPLVPDTYGRVAQAEGVYRVYNPGDRPIEAEMVDLGAAPAGEWHLREPGGHVVPSQASKGGRLYALVSLPRHSALTLYRCPGPAPVRASDLRVEQSGLGSGQGRLTLSNARLSVTLEETQGGVVTSLRSSATGRDYGAASFGATEGVFGKADPLHPAQTTLAYMCEKRRGLAGPAHIALESEGPLFAEARITARLGGRMVRTALLFPAHAAEMRLERVIEPALARPGEELVVLDVPLRRQAITKIFPNFTGVVEARDQPHFGWREAPYVPPYATLMAPDDFAESLSFVLRAQEGLGRFRQGIWPRHRPQPGPAELAQLEYIAAPGAGRASVVLTVLLHTGHQRVARRRLEEPEPYAIEVAAPRWEGERAAADAPADWHLPYHHWRVPVAVTGPTRAGQWLGLALEEGMPPDADYRLLALDGTSAAMVPVRLDAAGKAVMWQATGEDAARSYLLYFDRDAGGPDLLREGATGPIGQTLQDPSFEEVSSAWQLDHARIQEGDAVAGRRALCLDAGPTGALSLATNPTMAVRPNSTYRLTFQAKAEGGPAPVRTNLYAGASYDFPQLAVTIEPGEWRTYTVSLVTGTFPPGVWPALRLWINTAGHRAVVDDVRLEWVGERLDVPAGARVEVAGPVEESGGG